MDIPKFTCHGRLYAEHPILGLLEMGSWGWSPVGAGAAEWVRANKDGE